MASGTVITALSPASPLLASVKAELKMKRSSLLGAENECGHHRRQHE
jgi:hypothetical protein